MPASFTSLFGVRALVGAATVLVAGLDAASALELLPLGELAGGSARIGYASASGQIYVPDRTSGAVVIYGLGEDGFGRRGSLDLAAFGMPVAAAADEAHVVVAVEGTVTTAKGRLVVFKASGGLLGSAPAGFAPADLALAPDGSFAAVANSGTASDDGTADPVGSISLIDLPSLNLRAAGFAGLDRASLDPSTRFDAPAGTALMQIATPARVVVSADSRTVYALLPANNALAEISVETASLERLGGLGYQDFSAKPFDVSNKDYTIRLKNWPVLAFNQPSDLALFERRGKSYLLTANRGAPPAGTVRAGAVTLDPVLYPGAADLQRPENLGRYLISSTRGDADSDGDFDTLYGFGGRSISVLDTKGREVWDSGSRISRYLAGARIDLFNTDGPGGHPDNASPGLGVAPKSIATGGAFGRRYAFVGLGAGGMVAFEVQRPGKVRWAGYFDLKDSAGRRLAPDNLLFVPLGDSPTRYPLLIVSDKTVNRTLVFELR